MLTTDRVFRRKIEHRYPEIAQRAIEEPLFADVSDMEKIHRLFCSVVALPDNPKSSEILDFRTLFIALVLKCFDPDYMNGYRKKVRDGIRPEVAKILRLDRTYVSNLFVLATGRVQIYKSMADNVNRLYELVKESMME